MPIIFTAALVVLPVYVINSGILPTIPIEFYKIFKSFLLIAYFGLILSLVIFILQLY